MTEQRVVRLGTRRSPLALAQSRIVKNLIEEDHPDVRVDIEGFDTRGDRDLTTALDEVGDTDFFNAELDDALRNGEIDFCVHSLKDLSPQRPDDLVIAAIPERENPRDAVLFRPGVEDKIARGEPLRIGTCSVRRAKGVKQFLPEVLPWVNGRQAIVETDSVRGPIDKRLEHLQDDSDEPFDGIVLALAGLNRLYLDHEGHKIIEPLLENIRWLVLPVSEFPCAPGQAALAIECRADDGNTRMLLGSIHDDVAAQTVMTERALLAQQPVDQQSAYGATALPHPLFDVLLWTAGGDAHPHQQQSSQLHWMTPAAPASSRPWHGDEWRSARVRRAQPVTAGINNAPALFIAHANALPEELQPEGRLWTSGLSSWKALAKRGIWVEGCAENLGFNFFKSQFETAVLELPQWEEWTALTHKDAVPTWAESGVGVIIPTYRIEDADEPDADTRERIHACSHFFWTSFGEYEALKKWVPEFAHHACGPGKTLEALLDEGVYDVEPFPSRAEWLNWVQAGRQV